jgi:hypothetical protein
VLGSFVIFTNNTKDIYLSACDRSSDKCQREQGERDYLLHSFPPLYCMFERYADLTWVQSPFGITGVILVKFSTIFQCTIPKPIAAF